MADMESHGRHRHRASKRASTEAKAADRGASGETVGAADWFSAPEWRVATPAGTAVRPLPARSDMDSQRSRLDRRPDRRPADRPHRGSRPGPRGPVGPLAWEGTERWVPQPRHTTDTGVPGGNAEHLRGVQRQPA